MFDAALFILLFLYSMSPLRRFEKDSDLSYQSSSVKISIVFPYLPFDDLNVVFDFEEPEFYIILQIYIMLALKTFQT